MMIIRKLIAVPLLTLCIAQVSGQSGWPPVGAKWHYSYMPCSMRYGCNKKEFIYFEAVKDTLLNDTLCTKIIVEYHKDNNEVKYLGDEYFFSAKDQVYNYHHGHFYLLYDFSLQVGDTVELFIGSNSEIFQQLEEIKQDAIDTLTLKYIISKKNSVNIGGISTTSIRMDYSEIYYKMPRLSFESQQIVKNIGSLDFMFGNFYTGIESGFYGPLRCYSDSSVNYTTDIPCETLTSSGEEIMQNNKVWVYPNPVTEKSIIYFPNTYKTEVKVEIINSDGKIMASHETCDSYMRINLENYSKGIFIYRVYSKDSFIGSGKLVKH